MRLVNSNGIIGRLTEHGESDPKSTGHTWCKKYCQRHL